MEFRSIPRVKNASYGIDAAFSLPLTFSFDKYNDKAEVLIKLLFKTDARLNSDGVIKATFDESIKVKGGYKLKITEEKVFISYGDYEGVRNAVSEISNLLKIKGDKAYLPVCEFSDEPKMHHRGVMIDLAHDMPDKTRFTEDLLLMAKAKFNIIHFHLIDKLGSAVKLSCLKEEMYIEGAYEVSEMKELIRLCECLGFEIIPEFDTPGHSWKMTSVYPELTCKPEKSELCKWAVCAGEDETYILAEKIIDELCSIFPGEYFHIGGDELELGDLSPLKYACHWSECRKCKTLMKKENIADRQDLYYFFMTRISDMVKKNGKKVIMWSDQIDTEREVKLPSDIIYHFWRVAAPKRGPYINVSMNSQLKLGVKMINSHFPEVYLDVDYAYGRKEGETLENWIVDERPYCQEELKKNIMGSEVCAWGYGSENCPHYESSFPPILLMYGDKMWNNDILPVDDYYHEELTRIILGFRTKENLDIFSCLGGAILPREGKKFPIENIKKDKAFILETKNILSETEGRLAKIYEKCIGEVLGEFN